MNVLCVTLPFGNFNVRPLAQLYKSLKEKVTFINKKNEKKKKHKRKKERIIKPILLSVVLIYESCFISLYKSIRPIFYFIDPITIIWLFSRR